MLPLATQSNDGITPLMLAAKAKTGLCHEYRVELFIDQGADLHAVDHNQWTALHYAAHQGKIDQVESLLKAGADIYALNADGNSPLILAVKRSERPADKNETPEDAEQRSKISDLLMLQNIATIRGQYATAAQTSSSSKRKLDSALVQFKSTSTTSQSATVLRDHPEEKHTASSAVSSNSAAVQIGRHSIYHHKTQPESTTPEKDVPNHSDSERQVKQNK